VLSNTPDDLSLYLVQCLCCIAILRVVERSQDGLVPIIGKLLGAIKDILMKVSKNPQKPAFNHYMFEVIGASIHFICRKDSTKITNFEKALFPSFITILGNETCQEFHPYVYQLFGLMLRCNKTLTTQYEKFSFCSFWKE